VVNLKERDHFEDIRVDGKDGRAAGLSVSSAQETTRMSAARATWHESLRHDA
jgi:hypothetical protein